MTTVLIMAGGTGGHVFPALAVADVLRARACKVVWLGTQRGIEARVVPAAGIPIEWVRVSGLRGKGIGSWLAAPFRLAQALIDSFRAIRRCRPDVVLGLGGFVAGPGGLAARIVGRPLGIETSAQSVRASSRSFPSATRSMRVQRTELAALHDST